MCAHKAHPHPLWKWEARPLKRLICLWLHYTVVHIPLSKEYRHMPGSNDILSATCHAFLAFQKSLFSTAGFVQKNRKTCYYQASNILENISCKGDNCILHILCSEESIYCIIFYLYCENCLSRNCYFVLLECVSVFCVPNSVRSHDFELPLKCVNSTHCRFALFLS